MKPKQLESVERAVAFAVKHHTGLFDDGSAPLPYASHPIEVMRILRYTGGVTDPEMLIAAVLHDTVEQSGVSLSKIRKRFGKDVASLVNQLTRKPLAEGTPAKRTSRFKALLAEVDAMDPRARAIKLADRISNLHTAKVTKGAKLPSYLKETKELLESIGREANPSLYDEALRLVDSLA